MTDPYVAGLVLAAGGKRRLGRPKLLLPYRGATLLDHTMATARACEFDQLLATVDSDKIRARVDLDGAEIVPSITAAMHALDPRTTVLVLLRGDQPGVVPATVRVLLAARGDAAVAVCRYEDGRGHPYAFGRDAFGELAALRVDRDLPRLLRDVAEVPVAGRVPTRVDSWADYEAVVAAVAGHVSGPELVSSTGGWRRRRLRD
jgi:molybdenum cofactor cytidylyltransferase